MMDQRAAVRAQGYVLILRAFESNSLCLEVDEVWSSSARRVEVIMSKLEERREPEVPISASLTWLTG